MSFWESFRQSYRAARSDVPPPYVEPREEVAAEPAFDPVEELLATIRERDGTIAEAREVIEGLAGEMRRLEKELKIARRSESPKRGGTDKYGKLRRAVQKHFHPDRACDNPLLAQRLESLFKELKAEMDRIEAS